MLIKVRDVGGIGLSGVCMSVCVCACARIAMLMRTILFLHLESISRDYDDGLSVPSYYQGLANPITTQAAFSICSAEPRSRFPVI